MVNWTRLIGRSLHSPIGSASIFGAAGCSGISSSFSCSAIHYFGVLTGFAVTSAADFFTASDGRGSVSALIVYSAASESAPKQSRDRQGAVADRRRKLLKIGSLHRVPGLH